MVTIRFTLIVVAWAGAEISAGNAASTVARLTELTDERPMRRGRATDVLAVYE